MPNVIPLAKTSVITVKSNGKPVADAEVNMGWGNKCGLLGCPTWQRTGKTGPKGTKEFKGLPSGLVHYCVEARKGGAYGLTCVAHPVLIPPKVLIEI